MKKFLLIFLLALLFYIADVIAAANLEMAPSTIQLGELSRNDTIIKTFTLKNTGNVSLTNIIPLSDFDVKFNATGFNLTVNSEIVVKFNATIPQNSATGNVTIGNIYFKSNEYNSPNFPLTATVKGGLEISDLDVTLMRLDGRSETHTDVVDDTKLDFGDGEEDEIRPGSTLQLDFRIENLFLDEEDVEIQDISVLATIKEIDDGEDIDEESESFELKPERREDASVTLKIPLKVEEGSYDIEILVKGKDEEGIEHKVEWELELEIKKESHDIYIETLYLTKDTLSCSRVSSLKTKIFNLGTNDEDEVKIQAKNPDLELDFIQKDIVLVEDPYDAENEYEKTIPIIVSENMKAGIYPIDFNVYIKEVVLLKNKKIDLAIEDCGAEVKEEIVEEEKESVVVENESVALGEKLEEEKEIVIPILGREETAKEGIMTTKEKGFSAKTIIYLSLFGTAGIIALVVVIGLLFRRAPKRKKLVKK